MERKVGERFNFRGVMIEVVSSGLCTDCFFYSKCLRARVRSEIGQCIHSTRSDNTDVSFIEVARCK